MKALRKFFLPAWLWLLIALPVESRADYLDDLKGDVARLLPVGKHQDKVRQFLKVRKFRITEQPKEKTMSGRLVTAQNFPAKMEVIVVFEFDEAGLIKDVRYTATKVGS